MYYVCMYYDDTVNYVPVRRLVILIVDLEQRDLGEELEEHLEEMVGEDVILLQVTEILQGIDKADQH